MNSNALICLWIFVFPISIIEVSTSRKFCFWLCFSSLHDYWPRRTWNSLVHTSWGIMERCEKRAFHLKMRKKKISSNIKTKCVTDILLTVRSSIMKDYTCITWWVHKRQTFILISIKIMRNLKIFCLQITGYLKTRKSFPISMFVVMFSGKCDLHIHVTFLQEF